MPSAPQPELQDDGHPPLNRTRIPKKNNGRYSFKQRTRKKLHPPPPVMKQFYRKPYKQTPTKPTTTTPDKPTTNKPKNIKAPMYTKKPTESLDKNNVVRCLSWYHPTSTLDVGTLAANTKRVFSVRPAPADFETASSSPLALGAPAPTVISLDLQQHVLDCIQEAVRLASGVKRQAQRLIGVFVDTLRVRMNTKEEERKSELQAEGEVFSEEEERQQIRRNAISADERQILACLCARVESKKEKDKDGGGMGVTSDITAQDNSDLGEDDPQARFLQSFFTFLYSGNYPKKNTLYGGALNKLIDWLVKGEVYIPPRGRSAINESMLFTPTYLVRSVSGQMAAELQRMYGLGTYELYEKVFMLVLFSGLFSEIFRSFSSRQHVTDFSHCLLLG